MPKQFVFLLTENNSYPSYRLSLPSDNKDEIEKFAREAATGIYGKSDSKKMIFWSELHFIQDKYQIIELHIPIKKYEEWHSKLGSSIEPEALSTFIEANNLAKVINDGKEQLDNFQSRLG